MKPKRKQPTEWDMEQLRATIHRHQRAAKIKVLIVTALIVITILFGVWCSRAGAAVRPPAEDANVPFAFDPNLCTGPVMDWAYAEPNISIVYSARFHTISGRGAKGLQVQIAGTLDPNNVNLIVMYDGRTKDPNGPGWFHTWRLGYLPGTVGVHTINLTAQYSKRSFSVAWLIGAGPKESDTRTILLNVVPADSPFLLPGLPPGPIAMKNAQRLWQYAFQQKKGMTKPTNLWVRR